MGARYSETATESEWGYWEEEIVDSGGSQEPWDMKITDGEASFSNCVYMHGPFTRIATVDPIPIVDDGDHYIAAKLNTVDGTIEMIEGADFNELMLTDGLTETDFMKIPLYKVSVTDERATVLVDYRKMLTPVLYV